MTQLKLMALDSDDLQVISALCQDAVLKVGEVEYFPRERRLVFTMNRFVWENLQQEERSKGKKAFERRKSVLQFSRVNHVQVSGLNQHDHDLVISILAISFHESDAPSGAIELVLAGDGAIRIDVECIEAQLLDTAAAWETTALPVHET